MTVDDGWICRRCDDTNIKIENPISLDGREIQVRVVFFYNLNT